MRDDGRVTAAEYETLRRSMLADAGPTRNAGSKNRDRFDFSNGA